MLAHKFVLHAKNFILQFAFIWKFTIFLFKHLPFVFHNSKHHNCKILFTTNSTYNTITLNISNYMVFILMCCVPYHICVLGLTDFLYSLDKRYQEKVSKEGTVMAKKTRKVGSGSICAPPLMHQGRQKRVWLSLQCWLQLPFIAFFFASDWWKSTTVRTDYIRWFTVKI